MSKHIQLPIRRPKQAYSIGLTWAEPQRVPVCGICDQPILDYAFVQVQHRRYHSACVQEVVD